MRSQGRASSSESEAIDYRDLLENGPWSCLILAPDDYTILSATNAYLRATMTFSDAIVGKRLFDIFPDDPADASASGVRNLRASLERVKATLSTDVMAVQRYPVRRPPQEGGQFEERFWSPVNAPLLGPNGEISCIIHRVEDVTEFVRRSQERSARGDEQNALQSTIQQMEAEVMTRAQELQRVNERLRASESRFAAMFLGARLGIVIMDQAGVLLEENPAFRRMTGYTGERLRQTRLSSLMDETGRALCDERVESLRRGDSETAVIEIRFVKAGGESAWLRLSLSPIADGSGHGGTIVAIAEDITGVKATEERLRSTEHLVGVAGRVARMGGWLVRLPAFEMVWSKEVCDIHEVPYGTALAVEDGIHFYAPEWQERISEAFTKCVELGVPYDLELEIITAKGRRVWVRTIGEAVRDAGNIVAVQGAFQDISRRKKIEEEARRLSERLTIVLESLSVGFFILDHDWRFTYINREAEKMLLRTRGALIGRNIWEEFAEAIDTPFYDHYRRAIAENRPVTFEAPYPPLNIWVRVDAHPSSEGLAVYFRDVTEQHEAARRLSEQASLLDKARDAITVRGLDDRIFYWNRSAEELYGWPKEEAIGRSARPLIHAEGRTFDEAKDGALDHGEWIGELSQVTRDGRTIIVKSRWSLVCGDDGEPHSIMTIETDITKQKEMAEQLLRTQRLESLGTLASGIAHDLNNVLAPILMGVTILRRSTSSARTEQAMANIERSARRGAALVRQVLIFARGAEGEKVPVDLRRLIREIHDIAANTLPTNAQFTTEVAKDVWPITGDPTHVHQVLLNLVVNARDAVAAGGKVEVRAVNATVDEQYAVMRGGTPAAGPYVQIDVADDGAGMTEDVVRRIFDPFFTTKEAGKGTGLGLSTVLSIVRAHGGFIDVDTKPGAGSRFRVFFPAVPAGVPTEENENTEDVSLYGNSQLILVADDEEPIRTALSGTLEFFGYRVLTAANGVEAVALYARERENIDLIITDMVMPDMDGRALLAAVKRLNPQARVIGSTGLATGWADKRLDAVLRKPYTADALLRAVADVLGCDERWPDG